MTAVLSNIWRFSRANLILRQYLHTSKMPSALIILSDGVEEMEAIITADVLRRGEVDVTIAGLNGADPVTCSRNVKIVPDAALAEAAKKDYDIVICPGGMGQAQNMAKSAEVGEILKKCEAAQKKVACICAAPIALNSHGIGKGKKVTSHPVVKDEMLKDYQYQEDRVVVDGNLITSRGPGTAFEFALQLVETLQGKEKRDAISKPMILHSGI